MATQKDGQFLTVTRYSLGKGNGFGFQIMRAEDGLTLQENEARELHQLLGEFFSRCAIRADEDTGRDDTFYCSVHGLTWITGPYDDLESAVCPVGAKER